uniref:Uncharacterized protein n=1 Tax=Anguilla anguilla TaxID=7936 RepID=A0A0E9TY45_ANGAN
MFSPSAFVNMSPTLCSMPPKKTGGATSKKRCLHTNSKQLYRGEQQQ